MTLLRYPGGKSRGHLNSLIVSHILTCHTSGTFGDVFFGGGGITVSLLKKHAVDKIVICEKDTALFDLWWQVIGDPSGLIQGVSRFTPTVAAFNEAKELVLHSEGGGFDFLVVNRLSHGGRGVKSGPQGGYTQQGKYKIDCRWNATKLIADIQTLHELFRGVQVAIHSDYRDSTSDYIYVDPPYWGVGNGLYLHSFSDSDHLELHRHLISRKHWLLSYNNHPKIRELYSDYNMLITGAGGNGGSKPASELLIWP